MIHKICKHISEIFRPFCSLAAATIYERSPKMARRPLAASIRKLIYSISAEATARALCTINFTIRISFSIIHLTLMLELLLLQAR